MLNKKMEPGEEKDDAAVKARSPSCIELHRWHNTAAQASRFRGEGLSCIKVQPGGVGAILHKCPDIGLREGWMI